MSQGFFITGTDTGIGKTQVALSLLNKLKNQGYITAALKPIASGCHHTKKGLKNQDALLLQEAATLKMPYSSINPFAFELPIAPHLAAKSTHKKLTVDTVWEACQPVLNLAADMTIVEGAGGLLVPLNERETMVDLIKKINFPVILVIGLRLGCINHALLTEQAIMQYGLNSIGWIGYPMAPEMLYLTDNIVSLQQRMTLPYLGMYPDFEELPFM